MLTKLHEQALQNGTSVEAMETETVTDQTTLNLSPIAIVNLVSEGSPAFQAVLSIFNLLHILFCLDKWIVSNESMNESFQGIRLNDEIISVGSINSMNFTSLSDIGSLVERCKGNVVNVRVMRSGTLVKVTLIPGPWAGRGLIGCNIIPIESPER